MKMTERAGGSRQRRRGLLPSLLLVVCLFLVGSTGGLGQAPVGQTPLRGICEALSECVAQDAADGRQLRMAPERDAWGDGSPTRPASPGSRPLAQQTFYSTADTCVLEGYPTANVGAVADMWAGYDDYLDPDGEIVRSLVAFDISGLPPGQAVTKATLRLYLVGSWDYPDTERTITSYRATSGWSEMAAAWNNQPGYGEAHGSASILTSDWNWHEFDVTNLVEAWYAGTETNHGIVIRGPEYSGLDSSWRAFSTREGPYPPELVVEYGGTDNKVYLPTVARHWRPSLLFFDDFSDPGSGWYVGENENSRIGYVGGEYQIYLKSTSWGQLVTPDLVLPSDYGIEADCRQATHVPGSYGLVFDSRFTPGGYETHQFLVYPDDQDYLLVRRNMDGTWTLLIGWTYHPAIRSGQQTNRLRVERVGTQISFYVNDTLVTTYTDAGLASPGRDAGVRAYSYDGVPVDMRFDNFSAYSK